MTRRHEVIQQVMHNFIHRKCVKVTGVSGLGKFWENHHRPNAATVLKPSGGCPKNYEVIAVQQPLRI